MGRGRDKRESVTERYIRGRRIVTMERETFMSSESDQMDLLVMLDRAKNV